MYYATYKGIGISDVTAFESEQERNDWVEFNDAFSLLCGATKENSTFERQILTNKREIARIVNNKNIKKVTDTYNPKQWWYLRSVAQWQ